MKNMKPQVYNKLQEISETEVSYFYPQNWVNSNKLISYYELDNSEAEQADDDEYSSNIAIQVDVWSDTSSNCSSIVTQVNTKMKELGFTRTLALDLYETDSSLKYRKTMRFEKEEIL